NPPCSACAFQSVTKRIFTGGAALAAAASPPNRGAARTKRNILAIPGLLRAILTAAPAILRGRRCGHAGRSVRILALVVALLLLLLRRRAVVRHGGGGLRGAGAG